MNFKKSWKFLALLGLTLGTSFAETSKETVCENLHCGAHIGYVSEYSSFRAQKRSGHSVELGLEANYALENVWDIYAGIFTNSPLVGQSGMAEVDPYIGLSNKINDWVVLDCGVTHYRYTQNKAFFGRNSSTEFFFGVSLDWILSPALYVFYDYTLEQLVIEPSLGYTVDLSDYGWESLAIDCGVYGGYLDASSWSPDVTKARNHYAYVGAKVDCVIYINDYAVWRLGPRVSANTNGKDGLANIHSRCTAMVAFETALTLVY